MSYREELTRNLGVLEDNTRSFLEATNQGWPSAEMRRGYCELLQAFVAAWGGELEICPVTGDLVPDLVELQGVLMGRPLALRYLTQDQEAVRIVESAAAGEYERPDIKLVVRDEHEPEPEDESNQDEEEKAIKEALEKQEQEEEQEGGGHKTPDQSWGSLGPEEQEDSDAIDYGKDTEESGESDRAGIPEEVPVKDKQDVVADAEKLANKIRGRVLEDSSPDVIADSLSDQIQNITSWNKSDCTAFFILFLQAHREFIDNQDNKLWMLRQSSRLKNSPYKKSDQDPNFMLGEPDLEPTFVADAITESLKALELRQATLDVEDLKVEGIINRMNNKIGVASDIMVQVIRE